MATGSTAPHLRNTDMNDRMRKRKPKEKCCIPDPVIAALGKELADRFMSYNEVMTFVKNGSNKRVEIELILCIMEARGYLITEEMRRSKCGNKKYFRVMTKEYYEKLEEEHRENAKRRLLAAVSY